jgi:hypothetical protein
MVKCGVLFEVRTEFLNNIYTSFGLKGLISDYFLKQQYPVDLCCGEVWCSLWILNYRLYEHWIQRVNNDLKIIIIKWRWFDIHYSYHVSRPADPCGLSSLIMLLATANYAVLSCIILSSLQLLLVFRSEYSRHSRKASINAASLGGSYSEETGCMKLVYCGKLIQTDCCWSTQKRNVKFPR